ncbi:TetR/AcrR family transcriptional regulator [bacterium]|nr:TetR/AcrR family transcriptional regulator [bacterium]
MNVSWRYILQQDSDSNKGERILEAAARLMRHKSFKEISMDELAAEAKVAKGTLYLYFRSKGEIYLSLLIEKVTSFSEVVREVKAKKWRSAKEALEEVLKASLSAFAEKPRSKEIPIFALAGVTPDEIEDDLNRHFFPLVEELKVNLSSIFKSGIDSREFRKLDPMKLAGLFLHLLEYCYVHSLLISDTPSDPSLEMAFVKDILFKGIMA